MTIKIFLDDIRNPEFVGWDSNDKDVITVRNYTQFIALVTEDKRVQDTEYEISFDHDLGTNMSGYDAVTWLEYLVYMERVPRPVNMKVHSMNPVGRKRIEVVINQINKM